jgi:hypothetical protein
MKEGEFILSHTDAGDATFHVITKKTAKELLKCKDAEDATQFIIGLPYAETSSTKNAHLQVELSQWATNEENEASWQEFKTELADFFKENK